MKDGSRFLISSQPLTFPQRLLGMALTDAHCHGELKRHRGVAVLLPEHHLGAGGGGFEGETHGKCGKKGRKRSRAPNEMLGLSNNSHWMIRPRNPR